MKTRLTLILVLLIYIGAASHTHAQQKKVIKTMMIAGQDGSHYWQGACEAMKQILENSGMFKVDFVNPEKPDVPLNKNDAFQKVQKRRVQEKR